MSNSQTSFRDTIAKLYYRKIGFTQQYLDKYGGAVVITAIVALLVAGTLAYHYFLNNMAYYKKEWINHRCNPVLMPFAGLVHSFPNGSFSEAMEYTSKNYNECLNNDLKQVVGSSTNPSFYAHHQMSDNSSLTHKTINQARKIFNTIRNDIGDMTKRIFNRLANMLVPITKMFVKTKDIFGKTQGVLTTGIMLLLAIYDTTKAMLGAFVELLIIAIIILVALIVIMWIFPWDWPIAIIMTAIFVFLGTMAAIIAYWTNKIFKLTLDSVPSTTCFSGETAITLCNGIIKIKDIQVGDILHDGAKVTAVIKTTADLESMYDYHGIIVSGTHKILVGERYVNVKDHPESIQIENVEPYLYCLNTTTKTININNNIFADWDEIDAKDWEKICVKAKKYLPANPKKEEMHKFLEGGFVADTEIDLQSGKSIPIKDVCVNDILKNGERVLGIVKIDGRNLRGLKELGKRDKCIKCGPNVRFVDHNLGNITSLNAGKLSHASADKLYHLVTDTKFFTIQNIKFYDYNAAIESLLEGSYLLFAHV